MNYFYFHRMGPDDILAEHLIDERYARIALHPEDTAVPACCQIDWMFQCVPSRAKWDCVDPKDPFLIEVSIISYC